MRDVATKKEFLQSLRQLPESKAYGLTVFPLAGYLLCALFLWLLVGCSSADYPRAQVRKLMAERGSGSGVVIRPGLVLTARHVAVMKGLLLTRMGAKGEGVILSEQEHTDLGLIRYPLMESQCPCVKLAEYEAQMDEPVFVVGYPLGITEVVTSGTSQGVMDVALADGWGSVENIGRRLVLAAGSQPGNSGGGVFVYRDGEYQLVGILVEMVNRPGGPISFAVPLSDIKDFLVGRV